MHPMNTRLSTRIYVLAATLALTACSAIETGTESTVPMSSDSLRQIDSPNLDELYLRPDYDLSRFDSLYVATPEINFEKGWREDQNVRDRDEERIRELLANETVRVFKDELPRGTGLPAVSSPGPSTLVITPTISNLYLNSPFNSRGYQITVLAEDAGYMTMNVELTDSDGKVLLKMSDKGRTRRYTDYRQQERVRNLHESNRLLKGWSQELIEVLNSEGVAYTQQSQRAPGQPQA